MKKISTLFKKDPNDLGRVINEINPENQWVFDGEGVPTRKFDGTACAIIGGKLYKRYDVKKGKQVPDGAIPCQDADEITGHWPHWTPCDLNNPADQYHFGALRLLISLFPDSPMEFDGTYELCGPKIQKNPEKLDVHCLIPHGRDSYFLDDYSFESIREFLTKNDIEGIVFHHINDGRMCKIRKSDFGIKR